MDSIQYVPSMGTPNLNLAVEARMIDLTTHIKIRFDIRKSKNLRDIVVAFPDIPLATFCSERGTFSLG